MLSAQLYWSREGVPIRKRALWTLITQHCLVDRSADDSVAPYSWKGVGLRIVHRTQRNGVQHVRCSAEDFGVHE